MIRSANNNIHILQLAILVIERGHIQSIIDMRLDAEFNINSATKFVEIAMSYALEIVIQRPDISHVLAKLKECWNIETAPHRSRRMRGNKGRLTESF